MTKWYCPVCAQGNTSEDSPCPFCGHTPMMHTKEDNEEYYFKKAKEMFPPDPFYPDEYQDSLHYSLITYKVVNELEIFPNPLFDRAKYEARIAKKEAESNARVQEAFRERMAEKQQYSPSTPYHPHCPTCKSPNVKKISFAKGYLHWRMFGFFSKTAMSQWECRSCGYKW